MKKRPKTLSEAGIIKLADGLALEFWLPGAAARRERFGNATLAHMESLKDQPRVVWLSYLLHLLLTCPPLLDRPTGFEWILNQVQWELYYRKKNRSADRDFWEAFKKVRIAMQLGRPSDKAQDYHRYERVKELMKEQGISKTRAIELLAGGEGVSRDIRGIWRSLARVKREQTTRRKLLQPQGPAV
jgi:hypothetical protein